MKLIAKKHILCNSKLYKPGEELPQNNAELTKLWLSAGTAVYKNEDGMVEDKADETDEQVNNKETSKKAAVENSDDDKPIAKKRTVSKSKTVGRTVTRKSTRAKSDT